MFKEINELNVIQIIQELNFYIDQNFCFHNVDFLNIFNLNYNKFKELKKLWISIILSQIVNSVLQFRSVFFNEDLLNISVVFNNKNIYNNIFNILLYIFMSLFT